MILGTVVVILPPKTRRFPFLSLLENRRRGIELLQIRICIDNKSTLTDANNDDDDVAKGLFKMSHRKKKKGEMEWMNK